MSETLEAAPVFAVDTGFLQRMVFALPTSVAKRRSGAPRQAKADGTAIRAWRAVAEDCRPQPHHFWQAGARLRMRLTTWANPGIGTYSGNMAATVLVGDAASRRQFSEATATAAFALGLQNPAIVLARLDRLALETASVDALREALAEPAQHTLRLLATHRCSDFASQAMLRQVGLMLIANVSDLASRLREADEATADILASLAAAETSASMIRACCAGLVRRYPGLRQILARWTGIEGGAGLAAVLSDTHAFLMAQSMRQTAQFSEGHDDRLDQICAIRDAGEAIAAAY